MELNKLQPTDSEPRPRRLDRVRTAIGRIGSKHGTDIQPDPVAVEQSPVAKLEAAIKERLLQAFSDHGNDTPAEINSLIRGLSENLKSSPETSLARASISTMADEPLSDSLIRGITRGLRGEAGEMGITDLRGLLRRGTVTDYTLPASRKAYDKPIDVEDIFRTVAFTQEPAVTRDPHGSNRDLVIPTDLDRVVLGFSSLGLTHPGNHEGNPVTITIAVCPHPDIQQ